MYLFRMFKNSIPLLFKTGIYLSLYCQQLLINRIASQQIIFQNPIRPPAELSATLTLYAIADRNNNIQIICLYRLVGKRKVQKMHIAFFIQLSFFKYIVYMARYDRTILLKQFRYLLLRQPYCLLC